jgi:adenylate cyclase
LLATVALCAAAVGVLAYSVKALDAVELSSIDARFQLRGNEPPRQDIVIVAVDPATLRELNLPPKLPRELHARMVDRLHRAGARLITYDFQFTGPRPGTDRLVRALAAARPVVLASADDQTGRPIPVPGGTQNSKLSRVVIGSVGLPTDRDGKIRRMLYAPVTTKSLAVVAAEIWQGHKVVESNFDDNFAWIDYRGPPGTFRTYSFARVLAGGVPAQAFKGKLVLVGATAPIEKDVFQTPMSDTPMAGVEVEANALDTILEGLPLVPASDALGYALIIALALISPLASGRWRTGWAVAATVGSGVLFLVASQLTFDSGLIVPVTYPVAALALGCVGTVVVDYRTERRQRHRLRLLFARFVPIDVVDEVIARTGDDLRIGGVRRDGTVLFCDLRGFTSFSELLEPEAVVSVINRYLTAVSDAILDHGGAVVDFAGDGVMALFGAPIEQPDHADRALAAARTILQVQLPRLNEWLRDEGHSHQFGLGIGLSSGVVLSGNVGSPRRVEYTAIGDTTNTAARLEAATKNTPHALLMSDSTRTRLRHRPTDLQFVGDIEIRGRQGATRAWTITGAGATSGIEPDTFGPGEPSDRS